ncbi:MSP (Major sperm protein) domain family protein [Brugia pahangi]
MFDVLQGLIGFIIFSSILFTASLIICESNSRPQRRHNEGMRNDKNYAKTDTISQTGKFGEKKSHSKTMSTESTKRVEKRKAQKLSKSKSKTNKSRKLSKQIDSSTSTKSVEDLSIRQKQSSRWERFPKHSTVQTFQYSTTNGSMIRNIDEKLKEGLKMEPRLLNWNISGGIQKVYLTNPTDERRAIKVKCSDNYLYRVSHVYSFVEPGETAGIDIIRQNGSAKADKMIFLWTKAEKSDENASKLFNKHFSYPMVVLPLTVNNAIA